jgi:hypothetical protein
VDAYGEPWHVADLGIICEPERRQQLTEVISEGFLHENRFQNPGSIEDFTGVAHFVAFANTGDGMPYCFDFGADPKEPSVVYWDAGWQRVAPNFTAFVALFVPETLEPSPRDLLRAWALKYVLDPREENRPLFELLPGFYAHVSPEERHRVEAEVREDLERRGMTDDQWRAHEELWARLRATHQSN